MIDYNYFEYQAKIIRTKFVSDKTYLTKRFICKLGYTPNFCSPKSFNEKVTARMIFERSPLFTKLADKCAVRELVSAKIGDSYFVPLFGIYKCFDEIDFEQIPDQFVLKCTHDSGSAIVCRDKKNFDIAAIRAKIKNHLKMNMYFRKREWHYKDICPQVLIEQYVDLYVDPESQSTITTCRVHCFEGKPEYLEIDVQDSQGKDYSNMYDTEWELQPFRVDLKENSPIALAKPQQFKDILELSEKLCFAYGYSRVDFLLSQDHVYFSEITLTPNAGRMVITPVEWDLKLGALWRSY
ncbi:glycosyltransferase [Acinetobacter dispersus]|uniref:ATP-grasp fold amidoligase family protein n=1 Tax=Acinetobacter dispersus TaxID=70348 RepID=UPI001F4A6D9F|nr:ATP-grasp fold amidoligase family protein [Acinetobacter dispersus]MCH7385145.1 glycosyltransferase [Acinetobacter dispersus]